MLRNLKQSSVVAQAGEENQPGESTLVMCMCVPVGYDLGNGKGASYTTLENKMEIYLTTINLLK